MKKLELNQMESLNGGGKCIDYLAANSSFSEREACVVCAAANGAVIGGVSTGGAGLLLGWLGGALWGAIDC